MAGQSDSRFTFWGSYLEAANLMEEKDRLSFIFALVNYGIYGEEPDDITPTAKAALMLVKPGIDKAAKRTIRYQKSAQHASNLQTDCSQVASDDDAECAPNIDIDKEVEVEVDTDKDVDKETEESKTLVSVSRRFTPPTEDEARAYGDEYVQRKGYPPGSFDADRFMAFYESKGWKVGQAPMKDWRAAVRNSVIDGWTIAKGRASPAHQPSAAALAAARRTETVTEF